MTRDNLQTQRSCAEVVEKVAFAAESALHSISIEGKNFGRKNFLRGKYMYALEIFYNLSFYRLLNELTILAFFSNT